MKLFKKATVLFTLLLVSFLVVSCGGTDATTTETTTAESTTTSNTDATTTEGTTTEVTTEAPNSEPYFEGLFTNQTYYKGSTALDLLAGAKAYDAEDGELEIELVGAYSATRTGTYEVYAVAEDSDGNFVSELITLTVKELSSYSIPETLTTDEISIDLWHSNGATVENALIQYAEDFKDVYPNITVNIIKSGNNYDELRQNVINAIRGGQIPNIVQNYPDHVMEYIDNSAVISLTPYISHPLYGYSPDVESESFLDILESYRYENSQYTTDGEYYSLPFNKSTEVMIYNKTMFDALIADGVIDEVPTTWQGLFDVSDELSAIAPDVIDQICAKLNQSTTLTLHKTPEEIQAIKDNFVPITYDSPANAFITLTRQWGGQYTGLSAQREGLILFDNAQTRQMLGYFFDNRDTNFTLPGLWGYEYASDAFKTGQAAVTFGSTGGARYNTPSVVNGEFVFEFGVMPMPYNADMPEERTAIQQGTNMSVTTAGTDQEKLASWLFLKYLTSKDVQLDFALQTGYSPVRSSVYDEASYINFTQALDTQGNPLNDGNITKEVGEMIMKAYAANAAMQQANYLFFDQAFVGSSNARAEVEVAFERVILGSLDGTTKEEIIENAIAAAKSNAERVLN